MKIKVGSDFSGVGAFEQALKRLGIDFETIFACDMDKYARKTYIANYGEPAYYPENVYDREIPAESLDIYMTSPPCQAFSIAGKRLGKDDERGILFFNSHEFIRVNKPRFFIFENVKGLLSDDKTSKDDIHGRTFREWINYLGGKSVNGVPVLFPHDEAVPYHIYHTVINAKDHNIPQNRERVFIVGIRDDADNVFSWPHEQPLTKRLRDVLEENVDPKYYLSQQAVERLLRKTYSDPKIDPEIAGTINTKNNSPQCSFDSGTTLIQVIGNTNPSGNGMNGNVFHENGISPTLSTNKGEGIKIYSDSKKSREREFRDIAPPLRANTGAGHNDYVIHQRGRGHVNDSIQDICPSITKSAFEQNNTVIQLNQSTESGGKQPYQQNRVYSDEGISPALCKDKSDICIPVLTPDRLEKRQNGRRFKEDGEPFLTLTAQDKHGIYNGITIRRLTPTECFRLMGFPDTLVQNARAAGISDSQLYKQAGNSIVVDVLANIINGIKPLRLSGDKFK